MYCSMIYIFRVHLQEFLRWPRILSRASRSVKRRRSVDTLRRTSPPLPRRFPRRVPWVLKVERAGFVPRGLIPSRRDDRGTRERLGVRPHFGVGGAVMFTLLLWKKSMLVSISVLQRVIIKTSYNCCHNTEYVLRTCGRKSRNRKLLIVASKPYGTREGETWCSHRSVGRLSILI